MGEKGVVKYASHSLYSKTLKGVIPLTRPTLPPALASRSEFQFSGKKKNKKKQTEVVLGGRKMVRGQDEKEKKNKTKNAMEEEMENGKIWFNFTK